MDRSFNTPATDGVGGFIKKVHCIKIVPHEIAQRARQVILQRLWVCQINNWLKQAAEVPIWEGTWEGM